MSNFEPIRSVEDNPKTESPSSFSPLLSATMEFSGTSRDQLRLLQESPNNKSPNNDSLNNALPSLEINAGELMKPSAPEGAAQLPEQIKLAAEGFLDGSALTPVNALAQLADKTTGSHFGQIQLANQKEVDESKVAGFGKVAGAAVDFMAISLGTGKMAKMALLKGDMAHVATMSGAAAIQTGLFTPGDNSKNGARFLLDKGENAVIMGGSMAAMGALAGKTAKALDGVIGGGTAGTIAKHSLAYSLGGGVSGFLSAYDNAAKDGRLATADELKNQIESGIEFGSLTGAVGGELHSTFGHRIPMPMFMPPMDMSHMPGMNQMPDMNHMPGMNQMPDMNHMPGMNQMPDMHHMPGMNHMPEMNHMPDMNHMPEMLRQS